LQLAHLVEKLSRNLGEKRLTGSVFLDVAKEFDAVWVDGLVYKLTVLSYLVKTILSYLRDRTFEASFEAVTSCRRGKRAVEAKGELISHVLFIPYVNGMPVPSRHVELFLYADDTPVIATSRKPELLASYQEV
jgi:hypothetical protein